LENPQYSPKPAVSRFPQLLDVALVGPLDALDQGALLLGLEPLPGRELPPPALEAPEQLLQEQRNAPVARGQAIREVRTRRRRAERGAERHGTIDLVHVAHTLQE